MGNLEINSEEHIINKIRELNNINITYPHCQTNIRLIVENITRNSAEVSFNFGSPNSFLSDSEQNFDYSEKITVTFSTKKNTLLSFITNTDLGELSNNSFSTIKESIIKANPNSGLIINNIEFEYITYGSAIIRSNNPNFIGFVNITFMWGTIYILDQLVF